MKNENTARLSEAENDQGDSGGRPSTLCSAWFICSDQMPELGQIVWLFDASVNTVWIGSREDDADGWLWGNAYGTVWHNGEDWDADVETDDDYTPTHWMPLPSLPNADGDVRRNPDTNSMGG